MTRALSANRFLYILVKYEFTLIRYTTAVEEMASGDFSWVYRLIQSTALPVIGGAVLLLLTNKKRLFIVRYTNVYYLCVVS